MALLGWLLGTDRGGIVARGPDPLPPRTAEKYDALVARRLRREPWQYITGEEEFHGRSFAVDGRVLIPRPETEIVVEAVLSLRGTDDVARVLDVGTGSGCIAVTLALERPAWTVLALDRSGDALEVARRNIERHDVTARVELVEGDLGELADVPQAPFDIVVSNPPYVSEDEWRELAPEVRDHEPKGSLVPGPSGLEAYRALAPSAFGATRPGGAVVLELGHTSEPGARDAVESAGYREIEIRPDLRAIPRVLIARHP
jgi:release factor glutamine methyltransferase